MAFARPHPLQPGSVVVEGGHYTLLPAGGDGEAVEVPGLGRWAANTTETTRHCFALACAAVMAERRGGRSAFVGLMVGDLALPSGARPQAGPWAIPDSYRVELAGQGLCDSDVRVWSESYARNQGKRRLLDEARARGLSAADTYAVEGWALFDDAGVTRLASDVALDWEGELRTAALARGTAPLCPLVFAGLKRAIFRAGHSAHVAIYALADDPWIDVKLRAGAAVFAQLYRGVVGLQIDRLVATLDRPPLERRWELCELVRPGELDAAAFLVAVRRLHPSATPLEEACPSRPPPPRACRIGGTNSPCSG